MTKLNLEKKVVSSTVGGAMVTVLLYFVGKFDVEMAQEVANSIVLLTMTAIGYLTPHTPRPKKQPQVDNSE